MKKEEIMYGLKQAMQRGSNLELAKKSFINAGYNEKDVNDAANSLQGTMSQYPELNSSQTPEQQQASNPQTQKIQTPPSQNKQLPPQQLPTSPQTPPNQNLPQFQQQAVQKLQKPRKSKIGLIILIIILLLLLVVLGISFIFRQEIIDFITELF